MKSAWMVVALAMTISLGCQDKKPAEAPKPAAQATSPLEPTAPAATKEKAASDKTAQATTPEATAKTPEATAKTPEATAKAEGLVAQAKALADEFCACKDLECAKVLMAKGQAMDQASGTANEAEKKAIHVARARANTCSQNLRPTGAPVVEPPPSPSTELVSEPKETAKEPAPAAEKASKAPLKEAKPEKPAPTGGADAQASCRQIFVKMKTLCKAHPDCATKALPQLTQNEKRFMAECPKNTTPTQRACALKAQKFEDLNKCRK
jgi:hypothetical protein